MPSFPPSSKERLFRTAGSVALCCLLFLIAHDAGAQRYTFKFYGQAQGLRNLNVDCMLQDRAGFLWLGTDNGLFRYDGARFVEFGRADGLSNPYILSLQEDIQGRLWVGTSGGLFHKEGNRFENVSAEGGSIAVNLDSSMATLRDGRLLVVGRYRLIEVQRAGSSWTAHAAAYPGLGAHTTVNSVHVDPDQHVWIGCDKQLCEFAEGHVKVWGETSGVPKDDWIAMFSSRDGLWVRSNDKVLFLARGGTAFQDRGAGLSSRLINNYYVSFVEDKDGDVITSAADGIAMWRKGAWAFYGPAQGLSNFPVSSLLCDHDGSLWFGLGGHGLARWLGYGDWESWTVSDGLSSPIVWGMLRDAKNRIWVADDKGVSVSDPAHSHFVPATKSLGGNASTMMSITQDRAGQIWTLSSAGMLVRISPETKHIKRYPDLPSAHQVYADSRNRIWISTEQGLFEVDDARASEKAHAVVLPENPAGDIYRAVEDKNGTIWAAGLGGLFYLKDATWKRAQSRVPNLITRFSDLDVAPDGSLWVVTDFVEVSRLHISDGNIVGRDAIAAQSISSGEALFARADVRGWIWVGHDRGVDVFDGKRWRLFTSEDGLLWNDCDGKAFWADPDGSVWIGTSEGLSHFDVPVHLNFGTPLRVHIESVTYGSAAILSGTSVAHAAAPLTLRFSPVRYLHESEVSYRYRLIGIDPGWTATPNAELHYPPLPAGRYRFELVAVDQAWHEVSPTATFVITIRPPWWQTWIARLIMLVLLLMLARWVWFLRIRQLLRRQQELQRLVDSRTKELREQATHDGLTGLWNHTAILEIFHRELIRAARELSPLVVVLADLDHFKQVNDKYGHLVGDHVLREVGNRLRSAIRPYDSAGRYGGEEFLILLPNMDLAAAKDRLEALHHQLTDSPVRLGERELQIGCSLGVTVVERGDASLRADDVLSRADAALYRAKDEGRGRISYSQ